MNRKDNKGKFSSYVFLNDEKNRVYFSKQNPDEFIKYDKYEMRIRDKILIEDGKLTKTKVKWWGGGFAYPHLWKANPTDTDYQESFSDPRKKEEEKIEKQQNIIKDVKRNLGRKR